MGETKKQVINLIQEKLGSKIPNLNEKLEDQLTLFLESQSLVYCETCGLVFFSGTTKNIAEGDLFYDWKMLAFRHCWDNILHRVKISIEYFGLAMFRFNVLLRHFDPLDNTKIDYWKLVQDKKEYYRGIDHERYYKSFDANWDGKSRCVCSYCEQPYFDPKDACFCHLDLKPYLPKSEIESLMVVIA